MSETYVHIPIDTGNTGKYIRAQLKTINGVDVLEHFQEISDPIDNKTARVRDFAPTGTDAGVVTRNESLDKLLDAVNATNNLLQQLIWLQPNKTG